MSVCSFGCSYVCLCVFLFVSDLVFVDFRASLTFVTIHILFIPLCFRNLFSAELYLSHLINIVALLWFGYALVLYWNSLFILVLCIVFHCLYI